MSRNPSCLLSGQELGVTSPDGSARAASPSDPSQLRVSAKGGIANADLARLAELASSESDGVDLAALPREQVIAALLAPAIEAGTGETAKTGSTAKPRKRGPKAAPKGTQP